MTDYPTKQSRWRKSEAYAKWRNILAVFITTVLILAIANGFLRAFSFKRYIDNSALDDSVFILALNSTPPAVLVYQKEPKVLVAITVDPTSYFVTGNATEPLRSLESVVKTGDGQNLRKTMTTIFGADVENFVILKDEIILDAQTIRKMFAKFASFPTPVLILTGKGGGWVASTNVTQFDQIRLWWQLKSLSVNQIKIADFSKISVEIVGASQVKVRTVDSDLLHREIIKYTQNPRIVAANVNVEIENSTNFALSGKKAGDLLESFGYHVVGVSQGEGNLTKCQVFATNKKDYPVRYLASKLNCDIFLLPKDETTIKLVIGGDFVKEQEIQ